MMIILSFVLSVFLAGLGGFVGFAVLAQSTWGSAMGALPTTKWILYSAEVICILGPLAWAGVTVWSRIYFSENIGILIGTGFGIGLATAVIGVAAAFNL